MVLVLAYTVNQITYLEKSRNEVLFKSNQNTTNIRIHMHTEVQILIRAQRVMSNVHVYDAVNMNHTCSITMLQK